MTIFFQQFSKTGHHGNLRSWHAQCIKLHYRSLNPWWTEIGI